MSAVFRFIGSQWAVLKPDLDVQLKHALYLAIPNILCGLCLAYSSRRIINSFKLIDMRAFVDTTDEAFQTAAKYNPALKDLLGNQGKAIPVIKNIFTTILVGFIIFCLAWTINAWASSLFTTSLVKAHWEYKDDCPSWLSFDEGIFPMTLDNPGEFFTALITKIDIIFPFLSVAYWYEGQAIHRGDPIKPTDTADEKANKGKEAEQIRNWIHRMNLAIESSITLRWFMILWVMIEVIAHLLSFKAPLLGEAVLNTTDQNVWVLTMCLCLFSYCMGINTVMKTLNDYCIDSCCTADGCKMEFASKCVKDGGTPFKNTKCSDTPCPCGENRCQSQSST